MSTWPVLLPFDAQEKSDDNAVSQQLDRREYAARQLEAEGKGTDMKQSTVSAVGAPLFRLLLRLRLRFRPRMSDVSPHSCMARK